MNHPLLNEALQWVSPRHVQTISQEELDKMKKEEELFIWKSVPSEE